MAMTKKRKKKAKINSSAIILVLAVAVVVLLAIILGPKLIHECVGCNETVFGAGYEPNVISGILEDYDEDDVLCEDCAEDAHAIHLELGKTLDDYKRKLFKVGYKCVSCKCIVTGKCYEPSELKGFFEGEQYDESDIICEDCAEEIYAARLAFGADLEDFEKDRF